MRLSLSLVALVPLFCALGCTTPPPPGPDAGPPDGGACPDGGAVRWDAQPVRVDNNSPEQNGAPQLGIDASGNAIVVWEEHSIASNAWTLWARRRTPDGMWSTARQIDGTGAAGTMTEPKPALAVSAGGSAIVVFEVAVAGGGKTIWSPTFAVYSPASGWGAPAPLHQGVLAAQVGGNLNPRVAIDSMGNAVAVWTEDVGQQSSSTPDFGPQVYAASYKASTGTWSGPTILSSYLVNGFTETADVALDEQGDAVAAWSANPANSPIRAMGATFDPASATWGAAAFLDQCAACNSNLGIAPRAAFDSNRNAIVVWPQGQSGGTRAIYSARHAAPSGSWTEAEQLDKNLATNLNASVPRLVIDRAGNATAVWVNVSNDRRKFGSWRRVGPSISSAERCR